jgi:hypothetical protein
MSEEREVIDLQALLKSASLFEHKSGKHATTTVSALDGKYVGEC